MILTNIAAVDYAKSHGIRLAAEDQIARCNREIAAAEAELRAGHKDIQGLTRCLVDWHLELRLIQGDIQ